MILRALLIIALLAGPHLSAYEIDDGVYKTTGEQADVNLAIAAAPAGSDLTMPAGTFIWGTSGLVTSISKRLRITGAGPSTIIQFATTAPSSNSGVIRVSSADAVVFGGVTILVAATGNSATPFNLFRATNIRITDITYNGVGRYSYFIYAVNSTGVLDSSHITVGDTQQETVFAMGPSDAWERPYTDFAGTANMFYIEDCTFTGVAPSQGYVCDFNNNGVGCLRYNLIQSALKIDGHGLSTNSTRGVRFMEVYRNTWTYTSGSSWRAIEHRGGGGIYWGNVINSSSAGLGSYRFTDYGYTSQAVSFSYIFQTPFHYPIADQIGAGPGTIDPNGFGGTQVGGAEPVTFVNNLKGGVRGTMSFVTPADLTNISTTNAGFAAGATTVNVTGASLRAGNYIKFPGDTTRYLVTVGTNTTPGQLTFTPGLVNSIPAVATAITYGPITQYQGLTGNPSATWAAANLFEPDRDYHAEVASFNATTGAGKGTKAQMEALTDTAPEIAAAKVGVEFWVTDEGEWDSTNGDTKDGQLYRWNGSSWVLKYTPYTYPHPLRTGYVPPSDTTAPTLVSATINAAGTQAIFVFSESVSNGIGGDAGWAFTFSGGPVTSTYGSIVGSTLTRNLSRTVDYNETGSFTFTPPGNGLEDAAGNDLAAIGATPISGSTHGQPDPTTITSGARRVFATGATGSFQ